MDSSIQPTFIDTHCHLTMSSEQINIDQLLLQGKTAGITHFIDIGIDPVTSQQAISLSQQYPTLVHAAVGVHPHHVNQYDKAAYDDLATTCQQYSNQVVAYGEIGLDYVKSTTSPATQQTWFRYQLAHAKALDLPIIIHDREAHADTLCILKEEGIPKAGGVFHCFSGDLPFAEQVLALGLYISIPGIVTFKNARALQQVATHIPLERMLLETDSPFLAPVPYRGKKNQPAYLIHVAEQIAKLRQIPIAEVAQATSNNACQLFNLQLETHV